MENRPPTGWHGALLHVDLSTGKSRTEKIPRDLLLGYLGGRGLGVRLLREGHGLDPFHPAMPLIFAAGPLCGTPAPATARMAAVSRSPLTGTVFGWSAGGRFPHRLKAAGFDALRIVGKSPRPVAVAVTPGGAEILAADTLWGKTTDETISALACRGSVAAIGPAGENGVLFAAILTAEENATCRGGLGAVMGGKNLKAITADGDKPVRIADRARFLRARRDVMRLFRASPVLFGDLGIGEYGTPAFVDLISRRRMTPTENFRRTFFESSGNHSASAIRKTFGAKKDGCFGCPVRCLKRDRDGLLLPEYDAVSHFGALNGVDDIRAVVRSNSLCSKLGMDPVSAAATLAAWGESRGRFVGAKDMEELLTDIAWRRGDGDLLAQGSRRMAEALGSPAISMSVKSLELPAFDPRGAYGTALAYCTSNRGGCYLDAYPVSHEILRKPVATNRFSFSGKARIVKISEDANAAADSLAACRFSFLGATLEEYAELLSAATGVETAPRSLMETGERIYLTERFYNCSNGFDARDDRLPERFFREPGSGGEGIDIPPVDKKRFEEELGKYYRIRGLTPSGTFPDPGFLSRLP